jgi:multidrug efflux system membrane fusion protein
VSAIVWVVVLLVLAGVGVGAWKYYESKTTAKTGNKRGNNAPPPVDVAKATSGDMQIFVRTIGSVEAYNTVTVRTRIDGELEKVAFTEGQLVKAGDLLFQIDPQPYQVQLIQAQGQLAKDQATLDNAQKDVARYEKAGPAVAGQLLDTARATAESTRGSIKADQGAIDAANLNIKYCTITAPLSGRIGLRMVDQGNMVHAADTNGMAVITQLQPISVVFSPTEDDLPAVERAMKADAHPPVEALNRNGGHLADGKLDAVDNQIDPTTGTFRIKAVFANTDNVLFPNQFVNVKLLVNTLKNVVLVPDAAIQQSPTSSFVYVVKADQTVDMREVKTGPEQPDTQQTVVKSGVAAGEVVVTAGLDKLEPKMKVAVRGKGAGTQPATQEAETEPGSQPATGPGARKSRRATVGSGG